MSKWISVTKSKVHNLKDVSLDIPRNKFVVITGPSGSGKSSLAFDTIYAEGQRRYIESLSSYARQFLGQIEPPDVESITGLSPAIAIDQKSTSRNPRSTVGTITEIYDFLRVLFARVGTAYAPDTGNEITSQSPQVICERILKFPNDSKVQILSPVIRNKKGEHKELISKFLAMGFSKARVNGKIIPLDDQLKLKKNSYNNIDIVVDRLVIRNKDIRTRLIDSVELGLSLSSGYLIVLKDKEEHFFSEHNSDPKTGTSYPDLEPRLFSFNSPIGACPDCNGLGENKNFSKKLMISDENISILDGAITPLSKNSSFMFQMVKTVAKKEKVDLSKSFKKLPISFKKILFEGSETIYSFSFESENSSFNFKKKFSGLMEWIEKKYYESSSEAVKASLEDYMNIELCSKCEGQRLNPFALSTLIGKKNIYHITQLPLDQCYDFFHKLKLTGQKKLIADKLLIEIKQRLSFLTQVGLNYLTLNRSSNTLSGGEAQRIRLASQIGSALSGVLYVLDEPSIGLHQRDNLKLIDTIINLRDLGNTVIVVEHDEETMREADYLIDMGPKAGLHGGEVVAQGSFKDVLKNKKSLTAQYLNGEKNLSIPHERRSPQGFLKLTGATEHNLKNVTIDFPLKILIGLTGVSGSGKSTLVHDILLPALKYSLRRKIQYKKENYAEIHGQEEIQSVIELDQGPIGRTPKSNPATYSGAFDLIRTLFSQTPEAKVRGYKAGRFSFNVKEGRCAECEGNGVIKIEMHFLPDVFITCSRCQGNRYNDETLTVTYRGKNISDVLNMSFEDAAIFFQNHKKLHKILATLTSVGLGYMKLGQPATTLSGGEAQRLKLSKELAKNPKGHCFYVLDEPTTGLHFDDIRMLLTALNQLVELGHTVLVIEHNLDVIKSCDYLLDLGPEGGDLGGNLIAKGTPEKVAKVKKSFTGQFLKPILE